jgi:hypothetical protein
VRPRPLTRQVSKDRKAGRGGRPISELVGAAHERCEHACRRASVRHDADRAVRGDRRGERRRVHVGPHDARGIGVAAVGDVNDVIVAGDVTNLAPEAHAIGPGGARLRRHPDEQTKGNGDASHEAHLETVRTANPVVTRR